jgi:hypothetical protein
MGLAAWFALGLVIGRVAGEPTGAVADCLSELPLTRFLSPVHPNFGVFGRAGHIFGEARRGFEDAAESDATMVASSPIRAGALAVSDFLHDLFVNGRPSGE